MGEFNLTGRGLVGGKVHGRALVSKMAIDWLSSVELDGLVIEEGHDLKGKNVAGTILVYPLSKGSTSGSYKLLEMASRGSAPKAIINRVSDSVTVSGAFLSNIPMVHKLNMDPSQVIESGDETTVDGNTGMVRVRR